MDVQEVIKLLEVIRERKGMYVGTYVPAETQSFIIGFIVAWQNAGVFCDWKELHLAGSDRGWKYCAAGPIPEMQSSGMSDDAIADELFYIAIRAFQRVAETKSPPTSLAPAPNPAKKWAGPHNRP